MAVDIFEAEGAGVGGGHQFDHPARRMAGEARRLVEFVPAPEIGLDMIDQIREHRFEPAFGDERHDMFDSDPTHIILLYCPNRMIPRPDAHTSIMSLSALHIPSSAISHQTNLLNNNL